MGSSNNPTINALSTAMGHQSSLGGVSSASTADFTAWGDSNPIDVLDDFIDSIADLPGEMVSYLQTLRLMDVQRENLHNEAAHQRFRYSHKRQLSDPLRMKSYQDAFKETLGQIESKIKTTESMNSVLSTHMKRLERELNRLQQPTTSTTTGLSSPSRTTTHGGGIGVSSSVSSRPSATRVFKSPGNTNRNTDSPSRHSMTDGGHGEEEGAYCICQQSLDNSPMVACDDPSCPIEWFHWKCVGVDSEPTGKWFCSGCLMKRKQNMLWNLFLDEATANTPAPTNVSPLSSTVFMAKVPQVSVSVVSDSAQSRSSNSSSTNSVDDNNDVHAALPTTITAPTKIVVKAFEKEPIIVESPPPTSSDNSPRPNTPTVSRQPKPDNATSSSSSTTLQVLPHSSSPIDSHRPRRLAHHPSQQKDIHTPPITPLHHDQPQHKQDSENELESLLPKTRRRTRSTVRHPVSQDDDPMDLDVES